jgi:hypothetical protein
MNRVTVLPFAKSWLGSKGPLGAIGIIATLTQEDHELMAEGRAGGRTSLTHVRGKVVMI